MEISKHQVRAIEKIHVSLTRAMSVHYAESVGRVVDAEIAFVDHTTYHEFILSLKNPGCAYTFTIEALGGPAIFDYGLPVACALVNYASGGKTADLPADTSTAMDKLRDERKVIHKILTRDLASLEAAWKPLGDIRMSDAELETDPNGMKIAEPEDTVILVAVEVNGPDFSGLVTVCYPDATLESVLAKLGEMDLG